MHLRCSQLYFWCQRQFSNAAAPIHPKKKLHRKKENVIKVFQVSLFELSCSNHILVGGKLAFWLFFLRVFKMGQMPLCAQKCCSFILFVTYVSLTHMFGWVFKNVCEIRKKAVFVCMRQHMLLWLTVHFETNPHYLHFFLTNLTTVHLSGEKCKPVGSI